MLGLWLRSLLFNVGWYVGTAIIAIVGMPILLLSRRANVAWADFWIDFCLWWLRITCGVTHRLRGLENRPASPVILACKHQSSWETLAFHRLFPGAATVLKRELLYIPVVGWAMARAGNIAVERGDGARALRSLLRQAKAVFRGFYEALSDEIDNIRTLGGEVKDLDSGLVDFPGKRGSEEILLCWKLGEKRVGYWHAVDGGFATRRPIDEHVSAAPTLVE